ncbi:MAG TPA: isochorismatase family protein, partial [Chloroflexota bacterium]
RGAGVPIWFTGTAPEQGTPGGRVATGLRQKDGEPMCFPDGYDKFASGELAEYLTEHNAQNLVIIGSSTHLCVMYTATTAARSGRYQVVIPVDGVNTANPYEHDYALHQLSVLPRANERIQFTTLDGITFE